jgi:predicted P-loop ATPase
MLVFIGDQDKGKSTLARWLCPMPTSTYFIESHISPDSTDHLRHLCTKLVWEVGELGATTRKADREALKAFITRGEATFRIPWGKHSVTKPALASFIGTINSETGFLNDPTGHRRYLPVELTSIDFKYMTEVDPVQLWAQFAALYKAGDPVILTTEERVTADAIRVGHETEDNFSGFITKYYDIDLGRAKVNIANQNWSATTADIVDQLDINGVKGANVTNVGLALRALGLGRGRQKIAGVREVRWYGLFRNNEGIRVRRAVP